MPPTRGALPLSIVSIGLRSVLSDGHAAVRRSRPARAAPACASPDRQRAAASTPSLASAAPARIALHDALSACRGSRTSLSAPSASVSRCTTHHSLTLSTRSDLIVIPSVLRRRTSVGPQHRSCEVANRTTRDLWTERLCAVCCILILCMLDVMACHLGVKLCIACWCV